MSLAREKVEAEQQAGNLGKELESVKVSQRPRQTSLTGLHRSK